jgi:amphi-Trp domain-containing protein
MTEDNDFHKEFRLGKKDAADFLREIADSIEDEDKIALEGDGWKIYQPYEDTIPFRVSKDDFGLEVDLKMLDPDRK